MNKVIRVIDIKNGKLGLLCLELYICCPRVSFPFWMTNIDYWYLLM